MALPFLFLALAFVPQDKPPEKCTLAGTVANSVTGQPLSKVEVVTEPVGGHGSSVVSTTTDAKGHFLLREIEPGQYHLKGKRNGYLDTRYGARRAGSNGITVALEAGQSIADLQFKLLPFGVIAGTIRDPDGEPLARVTVTVSRLQFEAGRRRITVAEVAYTDDLGQYRVTGLAPGKYYVRAEDKLKTSGPAGGGEGAVERVATFARQPEILLPTLYPGVQDPAAASTVEIEAGARLTGFDIALPRSKTVRVKGHVITPAGAQLGSIRLTYGYGVGDALGYQLFAVARPDGTFEFPAVPPGSYVLTATAKPPGPLSGATAGNMIMTFDFNSGEYRGRIPLQVGTAAIEGVQVIVSAGAEINGRIVVKGVENYELGLQVLQFDDGVSDPGSAIFNGSSESTWRLSQGRYNVYFERPEDVVVRSITTEGRDILAEGLTIDGPGKVALEIVLAPDGGKAAGTVLDKDDKPVPGAIVVLVPEARMRSRRDLFDQVESDQYGRFEFTNIPPGDYKIFAWEDVEPGVWHDPDFLKTFETKGEKVTIRTGKQETSQVRVIAAEAR